MLIWVAILLPVVSLDSFLQFLHWKKDRSKSLDFSWKLWLLLMLVLGLLDMTSPSPMHSWSSPIAWASMGLCSIVELWDLTKEVKFLRSNSMVDRVPIVKQPS